MECRFFASYTWSHDLDITSGDSNDGGNPVNAYNWHADYGKLNWDIVIALSPA